MLPRAVLVALLGLLAALSLAAPIPAGGTSVSPPKLAILRPSLNFHIYYSTTRFRSSMTIPTTRRASMWVRIGVDSTTLSDLRLQVHDATEQTTKLTIIDADDTDVDISQQLSSGEV